MAQNLGYAITRTFVKGEPKVIKGKSINAQKQEVEKITEFADIVGYEITRKSDKKSKMMTKEQAAMFILKADPETGCIANAKVSVRRNKKNPDNTTVYVQGLGISLKDPKLCFNVLDSDNKIKKGYEMFQSITVKKSKAGPKDNSAVAALAKDILSKANIASIDL
jgi:hypothetical protein